MRTFFRSLLLAIALTIFVSSAAFAFTVSPAIIEVTVPAGASQVAYVGVENDSDVARAYVFSIQKFIPKGESGQQEFLPVSETGGLPEWMHLDRASLVLQPHERINLPVAIRVPQDARPGGYYAALFFSEDAALPTGGDAVTAIARTGVLFLVTVPGDARADLRLRSFEIESQQGNRLPISFRTVLENHGGLHTTPKGVIRVRNMFGSDVAKLDLNPDGARVLPSAARRFSATWSKGEVKDDGSFLTELGNEWRNFAFGKYEARLSVEGMDEAPVVAFYIWPWRVLLVALIGLGLLVAGAFAIRRSALLQATRR